ncbi:M23 family metallopeptidase [Jejuia spongiicola]|uniref:M23 family metallopeptidase n=1 Tax=Jejuia spongiicola TaxID=2942207 RepID=A0ABT0QAD8_9FLAO|nr:M23 family metallopeptidase [Jejuia spongiicola]MCL6293954.1 M23 family metallopeptidase [Jejuia spongiicola]
MSFKIQVYIFIICLLLSCKKESNSSIKKTKSETKTEEFIESKPELIYDSLYISKSFDFPVGKPDAKGYYNAQKFQENMHLGDDWNAVTGGNSDLGDPIYSIANGYVKFAKNHGGGWGNVIRIIHKMPNGKIVESLYAHCDTILVKEEQWVKKGIKIGTIGNVDGQYLAHLHLEIRNNIELPIGAGYSDITDGYLDPTEFIKQNR